MRGRNLTVVMMAIALVAGLAVAAAAQESEAVTVTFEAEVLKVEEGALVMKMLPDGEVRTSTPVAGREVNVDGTMVPWEELEVGTVLSATVNFIPSPDMYETISGRALHVVNRTVVVKLDSGEVKQFTVDKDFTFMVDGQPRTVDKITPKTKLSAERIKADPAAVITPATPITGKAPKE